MDPYLTLELITYVADSKNLLINLLIVLPLIWMIYSRFTNNRAKHLSTWKIHWSELFLLLNKIKNHDSSYKSFKNTNLVIILNGVSFWFFFRNLCKNQTFLRSRIKVAKPEKNPRINTAKQNYFDLHRNWTIVIFCMIHLKLF